MKTLLLIRCASQVNTGVFVTTLREESSQTNVSLQYKLLTAILSAVCSVIQQS